IQQLASSDASQREQARAAILERGEPVIKDLTDSEKDVNLEIRERVRAVRIQIETCLAVQEKHTFRSHYEGIVDGLLEDKSKPGSPIIMLDFQKTKVTDDDLRFVCSFRHLINIILSDTKVSDKGVSHLCSSPSLLNLVLENTTISDESLEQIAKLRS